MHNTGTICPPKNKFHLENCYNDLAENSSIYSLGSLAYKLYMLSISLLQPLFWLAKLTPGGYSYSRQIWYTLRDDILYFLAKTDDIFFLPLASIISQYASGEREVASDLRYLRIVLFISIGYI